MACAQDGDESVIVSIQVFHLVACIVSRRSILGYIYESLNGYAA